MKRTGVGFKAITRRVKSLDGASVEFGILDPEAFMMVGGSDDGTHKISLGHLAHIMEEGRTYVHKGGSFSLTNKKGESVFVNIKKGSIIHIPARPFFSTAYYNNLNILKTMMADGFKSVLNGKKNARSVLSLIGRFMRTEIKSSIAGGNFVTLSLLQEWKKGHNRPLRDSGTLYRAVKYRYIPKNKKKT